MADWSVRKGSLTIEAAIIMPLAVLLLAIAIQGGIVLYHEGQETALELKGQKNQNAVEMLYHIEILEKLIGE